MRFIPKFDKNSIQARRQARRKAVRQGLKGIGNAYKEGIQSKTARDLYDATVTTGRGIYDLGRGLYGLGNVTGRVASKAGRGVYYLGTATGRGLYD